jgi:hypothetical protein
MPILEPIILDTIERYFELLQAHVSPEEMLKQVVTADFETGFVGGHMWRGAQGLAAFLAARSVFFDEAHEVLQIMDIAQPEENSLWARTRLRFFMRRHDPPTAVSEEHTGQTFHSWLLRREPSERQWRVAVQLVDGFALLNRNAAVLFGAPAEGLKT